MVEVLVSKLKSLLLIPYLMILVPLAFVFRLFQNKIERTHEEVEAILLQMASGNDDNNAWDDFLGVSIKNKKLDKIRKRSQVLWDYEEFHSKHEDGHYVLNVKGLSEIQSILGELRQYSQKRK